MSNIETAAKTDVAAARSGVRAWMANHPFFYGAVALAAGAALAVTVHLFL